MHWLVGCTLLFWWNSAVCNDLWFDSCIASSTIRHDHIILIIFCCTSTVLPLYWSTPWTSRFPTYQLLSVLFDITITFGICIITGLKITCVNSKQGACKWRFLRSMKEGITVYDLNATSWNEPRQSSSCLRRLSFTSMNYRCFRSTTISWKYV